MPTAQNVCGPLCNYRIEELRIKSPWSSLNIANVEEVIILLSCALLAEAGLLCAFLDLLCNLMANAH